MCFALRHADKVLANSDFTRDTLVSLIGVSPERIAVVFPTVDTGGMQPGLPHDDLLAGLGIGQGQQLILSVGRLVRRKGFDQVIRSLPYLEQQGLDVHYALIGIGEDWDYLRNLADELGVRARLHLLGHVKAEDLPRWYNACTLFAMPNRDIQGDTEGFGLVYLEAGACEKPVLAGLAGGTGSAVVDGVTGLRVDGESVEAVRHAIARLLQDPATAQGMGRRARERVQANFTHQRRVAELREMVTPAPRADPPSGRPSTGSSRACSSRRDRSSRSFTTSTTASPARRSAASRCAAASPRSTTRSWASQSPPRRPRSLAPARVGCCTSRSSAR